MKQEKITTTVISGTETTHKSMKDKQRTVEFETTIIKLIQDILITPRTKRKFLQNKDYTNVGIETSPPGSKDAGRKSV